jgi:hypothetical protein
MAMKESGCGHEVRQPAQVQSHLLLGWRCAGRR